MCFHNLLLIKEKGKILLETRYPQLEANMKLESKLLMSLSKRSGNVVLRRDISKLGSASHLSKAIKQLLADGRLVRLGAGLYAKAYPDHEGKGQPIAAPAELAREAFKRLGIHVRSVREYLEAGQPALLIDTGDQRISRKMEFPGTPVQYVSSAQYLNVLPSDLDALPTKRVRHFVERFARVHCVQYTRTRLDDYAEAITRAAGDDVKLDTTGKLLVVLKKNDLINGRQLARLMTNHMREVKRVRSVWRLRKQGLSAQR